MKKLLLFLALVGLASAQITTTGSALVPGSVTPASSGGSGTVTSVSVSPANGVSGTVATPTTTPAITLTLGDITPSTITVSGISSFTGATDEPPTPMPALAIDVTKRRNTKTIAADSVFTFSGTPSTSGRVFTMLVTNSDSAQHTLTIPSSFAIGIGTITTTIIPASGKLRLTWQYDGSAYDLYGASPLVTGTGNYVLATSPTITTPVISGHATIEGVTPTGATGTGNLVFSADPIFTSSLQLPNAAAPTTDAFGELAGDNNAWAASRGALQFFDGTANTWLVGTLSSDTPSNGQVPTWNTGGTITWETPAGGAALTSTQVGYGDGSNLLTGEAAFTYNATTNTLTADNITAATKFTTGNITITNSGSAISTASGDLVVNSSNGRIIAGSGSAAGVLFGGSTNAFASLIRSGTGLLMRNGDNTAYTQIVSLGTVTNDSAIAGNLGEIISNVIASGSAVSLTTATTANVTSISLTAGDWDVTGVVDFIMTGTTASQFRLGTSSTSATIGAQDSYLQKPFSFTGLSSTYADAAPITRFSLSGTTTVYLVADSTFTVGSVSAYGTIRARRVR